MALILPQQIGKQINFIFIPLKKKNPFSLLTFFCHSSEPQDENVSTPAVQTITNSNAIAANAINDKLSEVSKIAESLDNLLRDTQAFLKMNNKDDENAERKNDGDASMDSRGSIEVSGINVIRKLATN